MTSSLLAYRHPDRGWKDDCLLRLQRNWDYIAVVLAGFHRHIERLSLDLDAWILRPFTDMSGIRQTPPNFSSK